MTGSRRSVRAESLGAARTATRGQVDRLSPRASVRAKAQEQHDFSDKYRDLNFAAQWFLDRFFLAARDLIRSLPEPPARVLEVGAGDGHSTARLREYFPQSTEYVASELRPSGVAEIQRKNPGLHAVCESIYDLNWADGSFDLVIGLEVLEHLEHPRRALAELARVSRASLLLSVPREPLWRGLNMLRFYNLADFGNTPGHVQHWSAGQFRRFVCSHAEVARYRNPVPWTMLMASAESQ